MLRLLIASAVLLAAFGPIGTWTGGRAGAARAIRVFVLLWLVAALLNLVVGVVHAGYRLLAEAGVFVVVFGLPAAAAWWVGRRISGST